MIHSAMHWKKCRLIYIPNKAYRLTLRTKPGEGEQTYTSHYKYSHSVGVCVLVFTCACITLRLIFSGLRELCEAWKTVACSVSGSLYH